MSKTKITGFILVILGLILLGVSVYFIFNEGKSNEILLTYGVGTVIYCFGFYLRIKIIMKEANRIAARSTNSI